MAKLSRRRFIAVTGIAAGLALSSRWSRAAASPLRWRGTAMGAEASITLYHPDPAAARAVIEAAEAEIARVEAVFSLFRRDSALVRLNRDGRLDRAPPLFLDLLAQARAMAEVSDGAFDVTVQPLWALYSRHFARMDADPAGPPADAMARAAAAVGWRDLIGEGDAVWFRRPGMAATFNGIAQGYVTDRVAELMRQAGIIDVLLDLGEFRAMGSHPDGRAWTVGVADPRAPDRLLETLELRQGAVASSGGYGTVFDPAGHFHHLFDPASGRPSPSWAGVTVAAATATRADGLSTALAVAPPDKAEAIFAAGEGRSAMLVAADGTVRRLEQHRT